MNWRHQASLALMFVSVAVLATADLVSDADEGTSPGHLFIEGGLIALGVGGLGWMARELGGALRAARAARTEAATLNARLDASRREAERWRAEAHELARGLGDAIDQQLERWGLTSAEKEIALLLLKGLSHKEVADIRHVGEATVRQQARAIYRKSGLSGRADLAAFFLEDLLTPATATAGTHAKP